MKTTQQQHPWIAAVRTTIQTAIPLIMLATFALIEAGPEIAAFIDQFWPGSPVAAWILGAVVFLSGAAGLLARLAALPRVDALLQRIFKLGSAPGVDDGRHAA